MTRVERERSAYDDGDVWEHSNRWHKRFPHVFSCPNTERHEQLFNELLRRAVTGKRVLELGCGDGENAARLLSLGASYVYGIDVADSFLARAQERAQPGRLEFANQDASKGVQARFDAIVGRSILHHIDYRPILRRLFDETLNPGGTMVFMEPLGSNPLIRLYTMVAPRAHTPDERSLRFDDLQWIEREFDTVEVYPFNFASLPAGIASSYLFARADNILLRLSDRIDTWLAGRNRWIDSHFRHSILVIKKDEAVASRAGSAP